MLGNADNRDLKVSVVTGPILAADDPLYRGVALPRQYWKVVAMTRSNGVLSATGYLLSQARVARRVSCGPGGILVRCLPHLPGAGAAHRGDDRSGSGCLRRREDPLDRIEAGVSARELLRPQDLIV